MNTNYAVSVMQGWQCPICKKIYSPLTPVCFTCYSNEVEEDENIITVNADAPTKKIVYELISPIRNKIEELKDTSDKNLDEITSVRRDAYNLAIEDVVEIIDSETENKQIVIEIPRPCVGIDCTNCSNNGKCNRTR